VANVGCEQCSQLDLVLLPGGVGTIQQVDDEAMIKFLRERSPAARVTVSVRSGSAILARAGLPDRMRATSAEPFFSLAARRNGKVKWVAEARWVEESRFASSAWVSAGTDIVLSAIARLFGRERARAIPLETEHERQEYGSRAPFYRFVGPGAH